MYEEIKITGNIGDGSIADELNKIRELYDVVTLLGYDTDVNEFYFLCRRKFGDNFDNLYEK